MADNEHYGEIYETPSDCIGCDDVNYACNFMFNNDKDYVCPCGTCIVKGVCRHSCDLFEAFMTDNNTVEVIGWRHSK